MFNTLQDLAFGGTIGSEFIGYNHPRHVAQALGCLLATPALHQHIKHVSMLINGPPEIVQSAPDADEHLIQKPFVSGLRPPPLERLGVGASEAQAPLADSLVADNDASCCQNQLDFPQAEAEPVIQPDRLVDDLGRKAEAPVGVG